MCILHSQPFVYYDCEGSSPPQNSLTYTLVHHLSISWTPCIVFVVATEYWYLSCSSCFCSVSTNIYMIIFVLLLVIFRCLLSTLVSLGLIHVWPRTAFEKIHNQNWYHIIFKEQRAYFFTNKLSNLLSWIILRISGGISLVCATWCYIGLLHWLGEELECLASGMYSYDK